ncbi:single-stranded DNA-binding protein [Candidatus Acetothermia bacterium]|jgi:single-strand DNA-binding protein|nr:single-stranded DNA-binding protein [Candidatus Acetothermia bacterium]MCI2427555.1 single-stranded DNA-binding protein [Candidatus Acetothermia bacterium]MCI2428400.1 single-stranded DNA-binding protein [Candidatus Acetothermia bacterium]
MAASLNKVILIGNLTTDPELKYTPGGTARTRFSIALNRKYKDAQGAWQDEVTFIPIVTWGSQAENCANYLSKGRSVAVEGRLRIDTFETPEGERKKVIEVVAQSVQFLGGPRPETAGTILDSSPNSTFEPPELYHNQQDDKETPPF